MLPIQKLVTKCKNSFQLMLEKKYQHPGVDILLKTLTALNTDEKSNYLPKKTKSDTPEAINKHLPGLKSKISSSQLDQELGKLSSLVHWRKIFKGKGIDKKLAEGLCAGQIIGNVGFIKSSQVFMGLFLLAPNICYPLHQHDTLEIYYVIAGEISIAHGRKKDPFKLNACQFSITPNNQVHSLFTGESPCLMAYIWVAGGGDLKSPNWWWEKQMDGSWDRICWERKADSSWVITGRQKLSAEIISNSGDY